MDNSDQAGEMSTQLGHSIAERLRVVCKGRSCKEIGRIGGVSGESARRYLAGEPAGAVFVARICASLGVPPDWVLLGRATKCPHCDGGKATLASVPARQLVAELARRFELGGGSLAMYEISRDAESPVGYRGASGDDHAKDPRHAPASPTGVAPDLPVTVVMASKERPVKLDRSLK